MLSFSQLIRLQCYSSMQYHYSQLLVSVIPMPFLFFSGIDDSDIDSLADRKKIMKYFIGVYTKLVFGQNIVRMDVNTIPPREKRRSCFSSKASKAVAIGFIRKRNSS